jgi:hypothetical protein
VINYHLQPEEKLPFAMDRITGSPFNKSKQNQGSFLALISFKLSIAMLHGGTENSSICIELPYQLKSKRGYKKIM